MSLLHPILANGFAGAAIFISFVVVFSGLIGGIIYIAVQCAKKRTEAMGLVAASLDMGFDLKTYKPFELGLSEMNLFKRGRSHKIKNLMRGNFADTNCMLFDYRYTTGSGKNSRTHNQTVVVFKICGTNLPQFTCKPEHFYHKFADMLGYVDINFNQHPNFSKKYRLNGEDESAVRDIFNDEVIEHLEAANEKPWSVDGSGQWLVIYRASVPVKPDDCSQYLLDSTTLLNAMTLT